MNSRIFDNLGLKVISLALGLALWYMVAGEQGAEIVFSIPLELRNVPEGFEVIEESAQQADVRVRGSTEIVRRLSPQDIQVGVDLSKAEPGKHVAYLSPDNVTVPFGVRVIRVMPASIEFELDRSAERKVAIVPRVVGTPADGFELANIGLDPAEVLISGPASRVEAMDQITTEPVSAEGLRETYTRPVQIRIEDPYVRLQGINTVEVTLEVREEWIRKQLGRVTLSSRPPEVRTRISPDSIKVLVQGPHGLVETLRNEDVSAWVEVDELKAGNHELEPQVRLVRPDLSALEILSIEPKKVRVRVYAREAG